MPKLTLKQKRFVDEYILSLNQTQAVILAGYNVKNRNTAATIGYENMLKPAVREAILAKMTTLEQRFQEQAQLALDKLEEILMSDGASLRLKAEIAKTMLDRAGYKPYSAERQSQRGKIETSNQHLEELVREARKMLVARN